MISQLPQKLREAIEAVSPEAKDLLKARIDLSDRYRSGTCKGPFMMTETHRLAYLSTRMPATYGAIAAVLQELKRRAPDLSIHTLLDLGSGPGTALWAACEEFTSIQKTSLVEKDEYLAAWGKKLAVSANHAAIREGQWDLKDLSHVQVFDPH
ncbi:MAG: hypothetical protein LW832_02770, partial [Parachlamydia sp.]|nr:hypothetical protein [Parachlamydia sp.]